MRGGARIGVTVGDVQLDPVNLGSPGAQLGGGCVDGGVAHMVTSTAYEGTSAELSLPLEPCVDSRGDPIIERQRFSGERCLLR